MLDQRELERRARRFEPTRLSIRLRHRERFSSYLRRFMHLQKMNDSHRRQLERTFLEGEPGRLGLLGWMELLSAMTGRNLRWFGYRINEWLLHPDGKSCKHCFELLPNRWMCVLCAGGEHISQYPHFDDVVCLRHRRWIGLHDDPNRQHPVTDEDIAAAKTFNKLRRQGRLDVRLFTLLSEATRADTELGRRAGAFPLVIQIAQLITTIGFKEHYYDPTKTFSESYEYLRSQLRPILGETTDHVARLLWLYSRPTFWFLHASTTGLEIGEQWPHDHVAPARVIARYQDDSIQLQAFNEFLPTTGDNRVTALRYGLSTGDRAVNLQSGLGFKTSLHICDNGHQFEARVAPPVGSHHERVPSCPICNGRKVTKGINDLLTRYPSIAAELSAHGNDGLDASQISFNSKAHAVWECRVGHTYSASPLNRTTNGLTCPICQNRVIVPGVNDVTTTHPEVAGEVHPLELTSLLLLPAGSNISVKFLCDHGHEYSMKLVERVALGHCPECEKERKRSTGTSLEQTHPELAVEWDQELNGRHLFNDFSHGSKHIAYWRCPHGHSYRQRIERKTRGYGCSVCSNRSFQEGANDIATRHPEVAAEFHPFLNGGRSAAETQSGSARYWWLCIDGHKTQQSIAHRIVSGGCSECPPDRRTVAA